MNEWHLFDDRPALDTALATHIANTLRQAIKAEGAASVAVSGGTTPQGMFAALAEADLAWDKVWITLVDERWVEPTHADSNERLVRENLLQGRARAANFIGLKVAGATATGSLRDAIVQLDHVPQPLSCVILGMGSDGHTASWFPRASNLAELLDPDNVSPLAACEPVTAPHERITLTLPVVLGAGEIILHITGDEKRAVLQRAAREQLPVAAITEQNLKPVSTWWAP